MKKITVVALFLFAAFLTNGQSIAKLKITDVEKKISAAKEGVLVINFWATFCKPCVAEIPFFIKLAQKYKAKKVELLLVSVDLPSQYPTKIAAFAKKHKFNTNIAWLNETNADYFCPKIDTTWSGSIPSTLILNQKTGYRKFFEEEISEETLEAALKAAVGE